MFILSAEKRDSPFRLLFEAGAALEHFTCRTFNAFIPIYAYYFTFIQST